MSLSALAFALLQSGLTIPVAQDEISVLLDQSRYGTGTERIVALRRLAAINSPLAREGIAHMMLAEETEIQEEATLLMLEGKRIDLLSRDKWSNFNRIVETMDKEMDVAARMRIFDLANDHARSDRQYKIQFFNNIGSLAPTHLTDETERWLSALVHNATLGEGRWYTGSNDGSNDGRGRFFLGKVRVLVRTDEKKSLALLKTWSDHRAAVLIRALSTPTNEESRNLTYGDTWLPSAEAMAAIKAKLTDESVDVLRASIYMVAERKERDMLPRALELRDHSDSYVSLNAWLAVLRIEGEPYWAEFIKSVPRFGPFQLFQLSIGLFLGNQYCAHQLDFVTSKHREEFQAACRAAQSAQRLGSSGRS